MKTGQDFVISYSWIATVAYFIVVPLTNLDTLASLIWLPAIVFQLIFCLGNFEFIPNSTKLICIILGLIMICSMIAGGQLFSTKHYVAMLCLINSLFSISCYSNLTISDKTKGFIKKCIIFITLLFTAYSFTSIAHKVTDEGVSSQNIYFVFNLGNSNMSGIFLFLIFSVLFIFTFKEKHITKKIPLIALCAYTAYMVYKTGARSCIVAVVALLLVGFLFGNRRINKFIIFVASLIPAIFMYWLPKLYYGGYEDIEILGKSIYTGRETYFKECLDGINTIPKLLFGDFAERGLNNAHNCVLAWLLSLGVIGVILIYLVYYNVLFKINDTSNKGELKTVCIACILCLFVESIAEASLFLGGFPGVNFITTMIALSNESKEETPPDEMLEAENELLRR